MSIISKRSRVVVVVGGAFFFFFFFFFWFVGCLFVFEIYLVTL